MEGACHHVQLVVLGHSLDGCLSIFMGGGCLFMGVGLLFVGSGYAHYIVVSLTLRA